MKTSTKRTALTAVGALSLAVGLTACPAPQVGGQTRMANNQANLNRCAAADGTAIRDPQPPRPTTEAGPYFICKYPNRPPTND